MKSSQPVSSVLEI